MEHCSCHQKLLNRLSRRREAAPPEDIGETRAAMERSPAWVSTKITLTRNTCEPKHLSSHGKSCNSSHPSVLHVVSSGTRFGQHPTLTTAEVKPMIGSRMVAHVPDFNESWCPIMFRSVDSFPRFTNKHTLSALDSLTRHFATHLSLSHRVSPRRQREITSPENVGIQARMVSSFANTTPSLLSSCTRSARICLFSSRTFTSIELMITDWTRFWN